MKMCLHIAQTACKLFKDTLSVSALGYDKCFVSKGYYNITISGADPGFFLGGGALVSCSTSTPINHIVFFLQNASCIRKPQVISRGGGWAHPLHPPPRSAHEYSNLFTFSGTNSYWIWRYWLHIGFRLRMFSQPVFRSHEKIGDCEQSTTHAADTTKSLIKSLHLILIFFPLYFTWNDRLILHP